MKSIKTQTYTILYNLLNICKIFLFILRFDGNDTFLASLKDLHYCSDLQMKVTNMMFAVLLYYVKMHSLALIKLETCWLSSAAHMNSIFYAREMI